MFNRAVGEQNPCFGSDVSVVLDLDICFALQRVVRISLRAVISFPGS